MVAGPNLLHGNETKLYGDSAYTGKKEVFKQATPKAKDLTNKHACRNWTLTDADKEINSRKLQIRTIVEQPFHTLKSIKARYRGMETPNHTFALLALINLDKWKLPLTGQVRPA